MTFNSYIRYKFKAIVQLLPRDIKESIYQSIIFDFFITFVVRGAIGSDIDWILPIPYPYPHLTFG